MKDDALKKDGAELVSLPSRKLIVACTAEKQIVKCSSVANNDERSIADDDDPDDLFEGNDSPEEELV